MNRRFLVSVSFLLVSLVLVGRFAALKTPSAAAPVSGAPIPLADSEVVPASDGITTTPVMDGASAPVENHVSQSREDALTALPQTEQDSLRSAFREARHVVDAITPVQAALPQNEGVRYFASNPGQRITARFLDGAMRVESGQGGTWAGTLKLAGGSNPVPVAEGSRVEFQHGNGITEWYENRPEGIEQGFTLARRPAGGGDEGIRVDVELEGLKTRFADAEKTAVEFVDGESGAAVLRYEKLKVWDATGRILESRFEVAETGVGLLVADAGAVYPVTIDPLIVSQEAKITVGDAATNDNFGWSVALEGDTALIGARANDSAGGDSGAAFVFTRNGDTWTLQTKLTAADGAAGDSFGWSVALSGDTALVGARNDDTTPFSDSGSAYVFTRSGTIWTQEAKLVAGDGGGGDNFGWSVAIAGDTALIGAINHDAATLADAGGAYLFTRSGKTWSQSLKLSPTDAAASDYFGYAVALSGGTALVGAVGDESTKGSVYVFTGSGASWTQQAKLNSEDGAGGDNFGWAVALSGETALVGAPKDDLSSGPDAGSAYVFTRSGVQWTQQAQLSANDGSFGDNFGAAVALSGATALIGAFWDDTTGGVDTGSAYVFTRSGNDWSLRTKLNAGDWGVDDQMGYSVALSGDTALMGAIWDDTEAGEGAGSAYVFTGSGDTWTEQAKLTGGDGEAGDEFGYSVTLSGETALIGVPLEDTAAGVDAGSVYVFLRNRTVWTRQAKLIAADGETQDRFGLSVALSGDTALIGAPFDDTTEGENSGSAYVFTRSVAGWSEQEKFSPSNAHDGLGWSVALSGETALIGVPFDDRDTGEFGTGSAYFFTRSGTTWTQQATVTADNWASGDSFGGTVALSGDTALIGAPNRAGYSGAVYVFDRNSPSQWSQTAMWLPNSPVMSDDSVFGISLAFSGNTAIVGASREDRALDPQLIPAGAAAGEPENADPMSQVADAGAVYVFARVGGVWGEPTKITAGDGAESDFFGCSVALSGEMALIGAYGDESYKGSAYVYTGSGTTWTQEAKLFAGDGAVSDFFGAAVALAGDTALIGAGGDDHAGGLNAGAAYVFRLTVPSPEITVYGAKNEITNGDSTPSATDGTLFGSTGDARERTFYITNEGTADLTLSGTPRVALSGSAAFAVTTQPASATIPARNGGDFEITFDPAILPGVQTATVTIANNDGNEGSYTFTIRGNGLTQLAPSFRSVIGQGSIPLAGRIVPVPGGGLFSGPGVVEGIFYPDGLAPGVYTLTYTVEDALGVDLISEFTATVEQHRARLRLDKPRSFDETIVGTESDPRSVEIENLGGETATSVRVYLRGKGKKDFRITQPGATIRGGSSDGFQAIFVPREEGVRKAKAIVTSSVGPVSVTLSGRGKVQRTGASGHLPAGGSPESP